jgi:hypothetical protein
LIQVKPASLAIFRSRSVVIGCHHRKTCTQYSGLCILATGAGVAAGVGTAADGDTVGAPPALIVGVAVALVGDPVGALPGLAAVGDTGSSGTRPVSGAPQPTSDSRRATTMDTETSRFFMTLQA